MRAQARSHWQQTVCTHILTARCGQPDAYEQVKVRIHAIDAPERKQPFGNRSRESLADLCFQQQARIQHQDTERYGRMVAMRGMPRQRGGPAPGEHRHGLGLREVCEGAQRPLHAGEAGPASWCRAVERSIARCTLGLAQVNQSALSSGTNPGCYKPD